MVPSMMLPPLHHERLPGVRHTTLYLCHYLVSHSISYDYLALHAVVLLCMCASSQDQENCVLKPLFACTPQLAPQLAKAAHKSEGCCDLTTMLPAGTMKLYCHGIALPVHMLHIVCYTSHGTWPDQKCVHISLCDWPVRSD